MNERSATTPTAAGNETAKINHLALVQDAPAGAAQLPVDGSDSRVHSRREALGNPITYGEFAELKLAAFADGLGLGEHIASATAVFRKVSQGWSHCPIGQSPPWPNDITDDGSPFEFSVAFDGDDTPKIRILVESQEAPFDHCSSWSAGLHLNEKLRQMPGVDLARLERVLSLFAPRPAPFDPSIQFSMWHAATLDDRAPQFKIYLNPRMHGIEAAPSAIEEALGRLGMPEALEFMKPRLASKRPRGEPIFFSLDLSASREARVKVYLAHENVAAHDLETVLAGCRDHHPMDAERWISLLTGTNGPYDDRPILTCFAFSSRKKAPRATVHVPIRSYSDHDAQALERACALLRPQPGAALRAAITRFAGRPLHSGRGIITYVSLKRTSAQSVGVTAYVAPECHAVTPPRGVGVRARNEATRHSTLCGL